MSFIQLGEGCEISGKRTDIHFARSVHLIIELDEDLDRVVAEWECMNIIYLDKIEGVQTWEEKQERMRKSTYSIESVWLTYLIERNP